MERLGVGVLRRPVLEVDLEAPGGVGRLPEELLDTSCRPVDRLRNEQSGCDGIGEGRHALAGAAHDHRAGHEAEEDAAPDAQSALPDREDPPPLVQDLVPARDHVVGACADDAEGHSPDRHAEDEVSRRRAASSAGR